MESNTTKTRTVGPWNRGRLAGGEFEIRIVMCRWVRHLHVMNFDQ
jgi:hypothetical protein